MQRRTIFAVLVSASAMIFGLGLSVKLNAKPKESFVEVDNGGAERKFTVTLSPVTGKNNRAGKAIEQMSVRIAANGILTFDRGIVEGKKYKLVVTAFPALLEPFERIVSGGEAVIVPGDPIPTNTCPADLEQARDQNAALQGQINALKAEAVLKDQQIEVQGRQVVALQQQIGGTAPGPISTLSASVGYGNGSWSGRTRGWPDNPARAVFNVVQGPYVRLDAVPVLFYGTLVPSTVSAFTTELVVDEQSGRSVQAVAIWREDLQGFLAVFYPDYTINGGGTKSMPIRINSTNLANVANSAESLAIQVVGITWFDGQTTFSGQQYSSGTVISSYE